MARIGEQSTQVLVERQANGSVDAGGMQEKYAPCPACPAYGAARLQPTSQSAAFRVAEVRLGLTQLVMSAAHLSSLAR